MAVDLSEYEGKVILAVDRGMADVSRGLVIKGQFYFLEDAGLRFDENSQSILYEPLVGDGKYFSCVRDARAPTGVYQLIYDMIKSRGKTLETRVKFRPENPQ